jgi:hypothetical protein
MNKIFRYTSVLFLWLAWLFLTAHMIIPHDHHVIESVTGKGDTCPLSNNKSDHHPGFPMHCHAFNDLTSEKATILILNTRANHNDLFFSDFTDVLIFDLKKNLNSVFDVRKSFPESHILELSALRAPPSFI